MLNSYFFFKRFVELLPLRTRRIVLSFFLCLTPSTLASDRRRSNTLSDITSSEGPDKFERLPVSTSAHTVDGMDERYAKPTGNQSDLNTGGIDIVFKVVSIKSDTAYAAVQPAPLLLRLQSRYVRNSGVDVLYSARLIYICFVHVHYVWNILM